MIAEQYVNNAISSLTGAITNVATTLTVASATNFPTAGNFHILIDSEIMVVTVVSGTTFTVTRGQEGTTAAAHASGAQVINILTAASLQNLATNPIGNLNNQGQGMFLSINTEQNNSNAFIMGSGDGINWDVLRPLPAYKPPSGYLKDPSIYYDGTIYWMVYTMATNTTGSTTSTSWGIASSPDLINWTHVTDISEAATVASAAYVQGPEWFVDTDGSVHIFVCVGVANTNCSLFERHPTSSDMTAWSSPVAITGTSLHVGIESPYVVKVSGTYYIFVKTNTNFYIELMTSTSLTSGYVMSGVSHWMSNWPQHYQPTNTVLPVLSKSVLQYIICTLKFLMVVITVLVCITQFSMEHLDQVSSQAPIMPHQSCVLIHLLNGLVVSFVFKI